MKVLYDHQTFTLQEYGGISRYFYELIQRFDGVENACDVSVSLTNNAYLNKNTYNGVSSFFPKSKFRGKMKAMNFVNKRHSVNKIRQEDFDVFHPTYYDNYFLKTIKDKPFVVTFLDMIHEKFSSKFDEIKDDHIYTEKKTLLERATKVIAISESTKRDIIDIFQVKGDNIEVVYLGNSLINSSANAQPIIGKDYILFVGNRSMYKNFLIFLTSVAELLVTNNLNLVCAGGGEFNEDEIRLINNLGLQNLVLFRGFKSDQELSNYYSNALCFVFPSLYEGFGIPVLESFACNCPIVLSNGGSLPEVGGDAALYFSPEDSNSIYSAVKQVIGDESLRTSLREKGSERLKQFSWDKTYTETIDIYKSIT